MLTAAEKKNLEKSLAGLNQIITEYGNQQRYQDLMVSIHYAKKCVEKTLSATNENVLDVWFKESVKAVTICWKDLKKIHAAVKGVQ